MMQGVNVEATVRLAQAISIPVIASGGVSTLDDVRALCAVENEGIMGAIIGRALYDGAIDLAAAQQIASATPENE
jgi:phosphoribosylformimino-5-aminoimidazole carboxamide ribotide isomerase